MLHFEQFWTHHFVYKDLSNLVSTLHLSLLSLISWKFPFLLCFSSTSCFLLCSEFDSSFYIISHFFANGKLWFFCVSNKIHLKITLQHFRRINSNSKIYKLIKHLKINLDHTSLFILSYVIFNFWSKFYKDTTLYISQSQFCKSIWKERKDFYGEQKFWLLLFFQTFDTEKFPFWKIPFAVT